MTITRTFTIDDLTAAELATAFCGLDDAQQARFFSTVGNLAAGWSGAGWCQQCSRVAPHLDRMAVETINTLAGWANDPFGEDV